MDENDWVLPPELLSSPEYRALLDAIDGYVTACGGDPRRHIAALREMGVINHLLHDLLAAQPPRP